MSIAQRRLRERLGPDYQVATIGPAGERLVRFATISHDGRHAGQMRDVAGELARGMVRDRLRPIARMVDDLDLARLDDKKVYVPLAYREQCFSVPV